MKHLEIYETIEINFKTFEIKLINHMEIYETIEIKIFFYKILTKQTLAFYILKLFAFLLKILNYFQKKCILR